MSAPIHPFRLPYVGLGLLDESSIRREGDAWTADYRIGNEPYLTIRVAPDGVEIDEVEDGALVATTRGPTIDRAIGMHGEGALAGEISRFWRRLVERAGPVWVQLTVPGDVRYSFVPAIGLGRLCVPSPIDVRWVTPEPGPLARRVGFRPFDPADPDTTTSAQLVRLVDGEPEPRFEEVRLHGTDLPGILVTETVAALYAANGPLRGIEWRPFVNPAPADWTAQNWWGPRPSLLPDGGLLVGFALVLDERAGVGRYLASRSA